MNIKLICIGTAVLLAMIATSAADAPPKLKVRPCDVRGPHYMSRTSNGQTDPRLINGNIDPYVPSGHTVKEHQKQEPYKLEEVRITLSSVASGINGSTGETIRSEALCTCSGKELANATLLDFLFSNPACIPKSWQDGKAICFLGTVYKDGSGGEYVHYLYHDGIGLCWGRKALKDQWSPSFHIIRVERIPKFQLTDITLN